MQKTIALQLSKEQFLKRLAHYVETEHRFQSHFTTKIDKPYFGEIKGSTFSIKNTPVKQRDSIVSIMGHIHQDRLSYRVTLHNKSFLLFILMPFAIISIFFLFYQVYFGLVTLGMLMLTIALLYGAFQKQVHQFSQLVKAINISESIGKLGIEKVKHREDFSSCARKPTDLL